MIFPPFQKCGTCPPSPTLLTPITASATKKKKKNGWKPFFKSSVAQRQKSCNRQKDRSFTKDFSRDVMKFRTAML